MTGGSIRPGERGIVRLFAIDLPEEAARAFAERGAPAVAQGLGVEALDPAHVEIFAIRDLTGVGLPTYLTSGQGVAEAALAGDRARLEALTGHVAVVRSAAFGGKPATLEMHPPLGFLGAWPEENATPVREKLTSASASGNLSPSPPPPEPSHGGRLPALLILALIVLIGGILVLVLR